MLDLSVLIVNRPFPYKDLQLPSVCEDVYAVMHAQSGTLHLPQLTNYFHQVLGEEVPVVEAMAAAAEEGGKKKKKKRKAKEAEVTESPAAGAPPQL